MLIIYCFRRKFCILIQLLCVSIWLWKLSINFIWINRIVEFWWLFNTLCRYIWIGFVEFIGKNFRIWEFTFFNSGYWFLFNILLFNVFRLFYRWKNMVILFCFLFLIWYFYCNILLNWSFVKCRNFCLLIKLSD